MNKPKEVEHKTNKANEEVEAGNKEEAVAGINDEETQLLLIEAQNL